MMTFYEKLQADTRHERQTLLETEMIQRTFRGEINLEDYVKFLGQAFHHVKHTVPLLMSVGANLDDDREWLRSAVAEYVEEEIGHQEWILNDIAACGHDKELARNNPANFETEVMVAYAYDLVNRINPVGFFGMVFVLEGTSVDLADSAANRIKDALNLPEQAFTYLRSHGSLDQEHIKFLENLINRFDNPLEQALLIRSAKSFYRLYRGVFESIRS